MFKGSIVALITPFKNDKLDEENYNNLILHHLESGTHGIVPGGTTGESPTLSHDEHKKIIEISVKVAKGKIPIIAGTGSNSTSEAVDLSKFAEKTGVDGLLIVTPYYNKPTQEGLFQHYKMINDNVGVPIIIYNIPSRSVIDMSVETMARLFELKNIVGVKDATGNLKRVDQQLKLMGNEFVQLTGEDDNAVEFNKRGGRGCISVTANVAAKLCSEMQNISLSIFGTHSVNDSKLLLKVNEINDLLSPLHKALFIESNPSPVKYASSLLKLSTSDVRLPLVKVTDGSKLAIEKALKHAHLI